MRELFGHQWDSFINMYFVLFYIILTHLIGVYDVNDVNDVFPIQMKNKSWIGK